LQPTYEHGDDHVVVAVGYQSHLTLEVTEILLEAFFGFHCDGKEVVASFAAPVREHIGGRRLTLLL